MNTLLKNLIVCAGLCSPLVVMSATLEPVLVTSVVQSGNLMPTIDGAVRPIDTHVTFLASSGGCTTAESFKAVISGKSAKQKLSLMRVIPDGCEALVAPVEITLQLKNVKNSNDVRIQVQNPVLVTTNFVH